MEIKLPSTQEIALRFDSIFQLLNRKYEIEWIQKKVGNHQYKIYKTKNIDHVLDQVLESASNPDDDMPYWAEIWPSSIALSQYIAKSDRFRDKEILELGCGVGVPSLIAKAQGAKVTLSDFQEDALRIAELNWIVNFGELPRVMILDWRIPPPNFKKIETVIASDVVYDECLFQPVLNIIRHVLEEKGELFLSEPNRSVARKFFNLLLSEDFQFEKTNEKVDNGERQLDISIYRIWRGF
jgi:predicted nicotinamide N-methyase